MSLRTYEQSDETGLARRIASAPPGWIGLAEATRIFPLTRDHFAGLRHDFPHAIRTQSAGLTSSPRGAGLLLWKEDVERLARIARRTRLLPRHAFSVLEALKVGGAL